MKKLCKLFSTCLLLITCLCFSMLFVSCGKKSTNGSETDTPPEIQTPETVTVEVSTYHEFKQAVKGTADIIKFKNDIDIRTNEMNPKDFFVFERKVTLDLNGKKIYSTKNIFDDASCNRAMLEISENAEVTITGNGKVVSNDGDAYAIQVTNGGKVIIQSGEFVGNRNCIYVHNGSAEIRGGKFSVLQKEIYSTYDPETELFGYGYVIDCFDLNIAYCSVVIKGGDFVNFNPKNNISNGNNTNYLITGYTSTLLPDTENSTKIYRVS